MKLISTTDFVIEQSGKIMKENDPRNTTKTAIAVAASYKIIAVYSRFLKKKLTLEMFKGKNQLFKCELFHEALICEGHNVHTILKNLKTVEDLIFMSPTLTKIAIKQIGL
jgi:hypothetical protein